MDAMKRYKNAS